MRDSNRIQECCEKLANIWHMVPDWRLSQLMINACHAYEISHKNDAFYAEDDEFIDFIQKFINDVANSN